jgi:ankyrin repeat protein
MDLTSLSIYLLTGMDNQFFVKGGGSLLHIAADFGSTDICKLILEHDSSSIDVPDNNNITPLFYAVVRIYIYFIQIIHD